MTNNLKPFDLEIALKDVSRVITRDGRKVSELVQLKTTKYDERLIVVIDSEVYGFTDDGMFKEDREESPFDLFLLPEEKKVWINLFWAAGRTGIVSQTHSTKEGAEKEKEWISHHIETIEHTISL